MTNWKHSHFLSLFFPFVSFFTFLVILSMYLRFQYSKYLQQKKYAMFLDEAFDLDTISSQNAETQQHGHLCPSQRQEEAYLQPWPCVPRSKKYLSSADSILDLPSYSHAACKQTFMLERKLQGKKITTKCIDSVI